jgi:2-polyprenyl-3-methyl-5-hydroxy-6-metoxy-1,4-benzoquinol methylase
MLQNKNIYPITYLSQPNTVSNADEYFDIADPKHFWVERRFEVFRRLIRHTHISLKDIYIGEIGCGHGLIQFQLEKFYGVLVDGFDLNETALQKSIARNHSLFLYDIHQREPEYHELYDLLVLFDVIEHIDDESSFIESALYHLKPGGLLAINVPALQLLYSKYDKAAGHVRRYTLRRLTSLCTDHNLQVKQATYWGFPLLPLILARKILLSLSNVNQKDETYNSGFLPPSELGNKILYRLSQLEAIPQTMIGTSVMLLCQKP